MAETTIKSTSLDFNAIKNNLKTFLASKEEFADYNFEGSGLSNILDVLAYNTHYNGLTANFVLNESFLTTAQLRGSVVSLAESIGYIPHSKKASSATVSLTLNLEGVANRPANIQLPAGTKFNTFVDNVSYVFQTIEAVTANDDNGIYRFNCCASGSNQIRIYEGLNTSKTFIVGPYSETSVYVIPDLQMDTSTAIVKVFSSPTTSEFTTYTNIVEATNIDEQSTLYVLREAPNGYYELSFGNGTTFGLSPEPGNKIEVEYLRAIGAAADGARFFEPQNTVSVNNVEYDLIVTTISPSSGGSEKEGIESVRRNAPYQYAAQNRMVTALDYSSLALRSYSPFIEDIQSWGGQDNLEPEFGVVFMSIKFKDGVSAQTQQIVKSGIQNLAADLSVITFDLKFADPIVTYIEVGVYFQFNSDLTTFTVGRVQQDVSDVISNYFEENVGGFNQSFRRSNLLTQVDEISPAVLSSRAEVRMQQRFAPVLSTLESYSLKFPVPISATDAETPVITSTTFRYPGVSSSCILTNKLGTNTLQVVAQNSSRDVIVDDAGSFNSGNGTVSIVGFAPSSIDDGSSTIKLKAVPANASAISPTLNNVLEFDEDQSFALGVLVESL